MKRAHTGRSMAGVAVSLVTATALFAGAATVRAQDYPTKVIRIIVPFTPGGGNDILARLIAPGLSETLGQPVIVENKPGASGNIGTEAAARSAPDGYTLLMASNTVTINPSLYAKLPFDLQRDFAPVGMIASVPMILVTNPKQPYKTLAEFIAFAKAHPKTVNFSSPGSGTPQHLAGELFARMSGTQIVHVAYKGTAPAIQDVVGGHVEVAFATMASVLPYIQTGRLRALGVAGNHRAMGLPDLPTFEEAGLKGYDAALWYSLLVPVKTPSSIVDKLAATLQKSINNPKTREQLIAQGFEPQTSTQAQLAERINNDLARWGRVVKETGVKLDQ